jgi:NtrC-family two-component system response regulator AlgB
MESATEHQGRILLVDDESAILRTFRYCLEDEGYSVATANSAAQRTMVSMYWRRCGSRRRGCGS